MGLVLVQILYWPSKSSFSKNETHCVISKYQQWRILAFSLQKLSCRTQEKKAQWEVASVSSRGCFGVPARSFYMIGQLKQRDNPDESGEDRRCTKTSHG